MKDQVVEEISKENKSLELNFKRANAALEVKESTDSDFFILEGYASTFGNVDRVNDIISEGAFQKSLQERMPKLLYQHKMDEPIGIIDRAYENDEGLFISAKLPKDNSKVRDLIPLIKMGALGDFSIGYKVIDAEKDNDNIRTIKEAELWEVSVVTIPANPKARILDVKSVTPFQNFDLAPRDTNWESTSAVRRIREFTNSQDEPSADYKKYFLFYDAEDTDSFGAYKLPYVDIVEGKPLAIVNALVSAKAAIGGARGGVDIPESDKAAIVRNIDRYLERSGVESNTSSKDIDIDDKTISVQDVEEIKDRRDFEQLLKKAGCFTNRARYALASLCKFSEEEKKEQARAHTLNTNDVGKQLHEILGLLKR